jgi:hypothetical protein
MDDQKRIVICAIVKQEDPYIHEWIQYHLKMGFNHIYLYDNHYLSHYHTLAEHYKGRVSVFHLPGYCMQMTAYFHFIQYARTLPVAEKPTWVAFIDVDEFIVVRDSLRSSSSSSSLRSSIHSLLATVGPVRGALGLNWVLFGNNHQETHDPTRGVLERFTRRQIGVNPHIKSIVRLEDLKEMVSPHHAEFWEPEVGTWDCQGNRVDGPYHPKGDDSVACIHHYFTKSNEEFFRKCARGRADIYAYRDFTEDFARHNFNDQEDDSAFVFLHKN